MMEYERVTVEKQFGCGRCIDRKCTYDGFCYDRPNCEQYNRLAELEDKIEQRLMIELPCMLEIFNGALWQVVYKTKDGNINTVYEATKMAAEKRLKELQK